MMQAEIAGQLCKISLRDAHWWSDQTFIERNKIFGSVVMVVLSSSSHLREYRNQRAASTCTFSVYSFISGDCRGELLEERKPSPSSDTCSERHHGRVCGRPQNPEPVPSVRLSVCSLPCGSASGLLTCKGTFTHQ